MTDVVSLEDERMDREDTDPRVALDRIQIEAQGKAIAELQAEQGKLYALVRKIAAKLDVQED